MEKPGRFIKGREVLATCGRLFQNFLHLFSLFLNYSVGNGEKTLFWNDKWVRLHPHVHSFPKIFVLRFKIKKFW